MKNFSYLASKQEGRSDGHVWCVRSSVGQCEREVIQVRDGGAQCVCLSAHTCVRGDRCSEGQQKSTFLKFLNS